MKVVIASAGVSSIANIGDDLPLMQKHPGRGAVGVPLQMGVVVDQPLIHTVLIDGYAAALALEELRDFAVSRSNYRRSRRCWNINRVVYTTFTARIHERVLQLVPGYTLDRNDQFHLADVASG